MYTKGMLRRYTETIKDPGQRTEFQSRVSKIKFQDTNLGTICTAAEFAEVVERSPVSHLADDFRARYMEFIRVNDLGA